MDPGTNTAYIYTMWVCRVSVSFRMVSVKAAVNICLPVPVYICRYKVHMARPTK